jgi:hypothetical protein
MNLTDYTAALNKIDMARGKKKVLTISKLHSQAEVVNALRRLYRCEAIELITDLVCIEDLPRAIEFEMYLLKPEAEAMEAITKALGPLNVRREVVMR